MSEKCFVCLLNNNNINDDSDSIKEDSVDKALIQDTLLKSVLLLPFTKEEDLNLCNLCYKQVEKLKLIVDKIEKLKIEFETLKETLLSNCISSIIKSSNISSPCTSLKEVTHPKNSLEFKIFKKWRSRYKKEFLKQQALSANNAVVEPKISTDVTSDHCYSSAQISKHGRQDLPTPYNCSQCDRSFNRQARLREHVNTSHCPENDDDDGVKLKPKKVFTCPIDDCGSEFRQIDSVKAHLTKVHTQDQFDKCEDCHKIFKVNEDEESKSSHNCFSKACKVCKESFVSKKVYQDHIRKKDCEKAKVVDRRRKIKQDFNCVQCSKTFPSKQRLFYHISSHSDRQFNCNVCQKSFVHQTQLQIHKRIHTGEKPYICQSCGNSFSSLAGLSSHLKTHAGSKPYKCSTCEKTFRSAGHLSNHNLIHTGQRPFSCAVCQKSFNRKENLRSHERIHQNIRPHSCPICPGNFTRAGLLRKHLKTKHCLDPNLTPHSIPQSTVSSSTSGSSLPILFENKQQTIVCVDHVQTNSVHDGIVNIICNLPSPTHSIELPKIQTSVQNNDSNNLTLTDTSMQETIFFTNAHGQYVILKE